VELVVPLVEFIDVASGEVAARRVEHLQVALIDFLRAFIVEWWLVVVVTLQQLHDVEAGDDLLAIRLQVLPVIVASGLRRQWQCAEAEGKAEGGAEQRTLHADSTRGQLITHIRPPVGAPGSIAAMQKPGAYRRARFKCTMEAA